MPLKREVFPEDWDPRPPLEPIWPEFIDGYLEAALWTSTDGADAPMDQIFGPEDFSQKAVDQIIKESNDFIKANLEDLKSRGSQAQHGHDFWLTRNRHGAGFWDRGYGAAGKRLTSSAHAYGEKIAYEGDDGKLYFG
jgi:hypothetical protein